MYAKTRIYGDYFVALLSLEQEYARPALKVYYAYSKEKPISTVCVLQALLSAGELIYAGNCIGLPHVLRRIERPSCPNISVCSRLVHDINFP